MAIHPFIDIVDKRSFNEPSSVVSVDRSFEQFK